jgi:hypothetical protein
MRVDKMALYTEAEINQEIWENREWILERPHPEDIAHEYADGALPIYTNDIYLTWRDLPDEYSNKFHEITSELPDRIEDLMISDLYLYYSMLYSGAVQELIDGKQLVNGEWVEPEPEVHQPS